MLHPSKFRSLFSKVPCKSWLCTVVRSFLSSPWCSCRNTRQPGNRLANIDGFVETHSRQRRRESFLSQWFNLSTQCLYQIHLRCVRRKSDAPLLVRERVLLLGLPKSLVVVSCLSRGRSRRVRKSHSPVFVAVRLESYLLIKTDRPSRGRGRNMRLHPLLHRLLFRGQSGLGHRRVGRLGAVGVRGDGPAGRLVDGCPRGVGAVRPGRGRPARGVGGGFRTVALKLAAVGPDFTETVVH
mmetsp:Transcript_70817/g.188947  ORF Transcript_70817/g.188947 Transcript_70817/m.188947 type:complete len:239 (-) Transcript_70817:111-827(-)